MDFGIGHFLFGCVLLAVFYQTLETILEKREAQRDRLHREKMAELKQTERLLRE